MILVIDMFDSVDSDSVYIVYIVYGVKFSSKLCFRAFLDKEGGGFLVQEKVDTRVSYQCTNGGIRASESPRRLSET